MSSCQFLIAASLLSAVALPAMAQSSEPLPPRPVSIDPEQAFVGERVFKIFNEGKDAGRITVHSRFTEQGQYLLHDHSQSDLLGVEEEILWLFDGETFAPVRTQVHGRFGPTYVDINWTWEGPVASGQADTYNFETGDHAHHGMEVTLPAGTLTRGAALFLANAMDISEGKSIELNWFNSQNGQVKPINLEVQGVETVTVPAGEFEVYRIEQTGGQPGNTLFVTTQAPRRIVRIDVTGTAMEMHLLPSD